MKKRLFLRWPVILGLLVFSILLVFFLIWFVVLPPRLPSAAIVVPRDYPTIQTALEHASSDAKIAVQAGKGPFLGPLLIKKSGVSIFSMDGRARLHNKGSGPVIIIRADQVTVRNFNIDAPGIGIQLDNANNCLIEKITLEGTDLGIQLTDSHRNSLLILSVKDSVTGIELSSSGTNHLQQIQMEDITHTGVKLVNAWSNLIEEVSITNAQVGISLEEGSKENQILSSSFDHSIESGVKIDNSSNNVLAENVVEHSEIGISLQAASNNKLKKNQVSHASLSGIKIFKSKKNQLSENRITKSQKAGIAVVNSEQNALVYNMITDCTESGIMLENAGMNLLLANQLQNNAIGVRGDGSQNNRLLRNLINSNNLVGIILKSSKNNLLLSNQVVDNQFGIALVETNGNHLLRNVVTDNFEDGISLLNQSSHNVLKANDIEQNATGILIASSSQNTILESSILGNKIGVRLFQSGFGTRIESNSISKNEFGIQIDAKLNKKDTILDATEGELLRKEDDVSRLVITNNTFSQNKPYDILNQTEHPVFAGGNRWDVLSSAPGGEQGRVSSGVIVPKPAWRGTIAVGTKDSLQQVILGRLLQLYLKDMGFKIIDLIGLGESKRLEEALLQGDVDLIWENPQTLKMGKPSPTESEFIQFPSIPAQNKLVVVVSPDLASKLKSKTISDLGNLIREDKVKVTFAIPKAMAQDKFESFASTYALPIAEEEVSWTKDLAETENLLKFGTAQVAIVEMITETLTLSGFTLLEDDKGFFAPSDLALILRRDLLERYPKVEAIKSKLIPLLTTETMHSLSSRVRLLHRDPIEVAREFLLEEGLVTW